jgi:WD40 repeat protein
VKIWDAATGAEVRSFVMLHLRKWGALPESGVNWQVCTLTGDSFDVKSVAFSADGKRVVGVSDDGIVRVWDVSTGSEVSSLVGVCRGWRGVGLVLRVISLRVWSWKGPEEMLGWQVHWPSCHRHRVIVVAFSPDGKRVVSGSADRVVRIWDAATGAQVSSFGGGRLVWRGDVGVFSGVSPRFFLGSGQRRGC